MPKKVILHLTGEDPVMGEMDEDPKPSDMFLRVSNLRKLDGKDVPYLALEADTVIFPWHRITFVEILVSEQDRGKVVGFFRP